MIYKLKWRRYRLSFHYYQTDSPFDYDLTLPLFNKKNVNEKLKNNPFGRDIKEIGVFLQEGVQYLAFRASRQYTNGFDTMNPNIQTSGRFLRFRAFVPEGQTNAYNIP